LVLILFFSIAPNSHEDLNAIKEIKSDQTVLSRVKPEEQTTKNLSQYNEVKIEKCGIIYKVPSVLVTPLVRSIIFKFCYP